MMSVALAPPQDPLDNLQAHPTLQYTKVELSTRALGELSFAKLQSLQTGHNVTGRLASDHFNRAPVLL
jgi:hypothetical protein